MIDDTAAEINLLQTRPVAKDEDADCDSDELSENLIADAAVLAGLARYVPGG